MGHLLLIQDFFKLFLSFLLPLSILLHLLYLFLSSFCKNTNSATGSLVPSRPTIQFQVLGFPYCNLLDLNTLHVHLIQSCSSLYTYACSCYNSCLSSTYLTTSSPHHLCNQCMFMFMHMFMCSSNTLNPNLLFKKINM